jgi:hypothetical protein
MRHHREQRRVALAANRHRHVEPRQVRRVDVKDVRDDVLAHRESRIDRVGPVPQGILRCRQAWRSNPGDRERRDKRATDHAATNKRRE